MQTIGRYEIKKELGRGAMGVVYLARDPHLQRDVAVKTYLLPEGITEEMAKEFRERFLREARAAASLSHPGIVTIHDAGEDTTRGIPYIAMELIQGQTLSQRLKTGKPLDAAWVFSAGAVLADALDVAHRAGIVHRDIKPANILIRDADGAAKIADFGVARLQASTLTQSGAAIGSPGYMSPEQVRGGALDGRSDLFSLAVVLYEALCGRRPFQGEDLVALAYSIAHDTQIPLSRQLQSCPAELDRFFDRALSKEPERRFPDGAAFRKEFVEAGKKKAAASVGATVVDAATVKMPEPKDRVGRGGASPATLPLAKESATPLWRRLLLPVGACALLFAAGLAAAVYYGLGKTELTAEGRESQLTQQAQADQPASGASANLLVGGGSHPPASNRQDASSRVETSAHPDIASRQVAGGRSGEAKLAEAVPGKPLRPPLTKQAPARKPPSAAETDLPPDDNPEDLASEPLPPIQLTVPAETAFHLALDAAVSSKASLAGDRVTARLTEPVLVGARVAIPAGSKVYGKVVEAIPAKKGLGDKAGSLTVAFERVVTPAGARAAISAGFTMVGAKSGKKNAGTIGGSAAGGALLGKIFGGNTKDAAVGALAGAAIGTGIAAGSRGQDVEMAAGSPLTLKLDQPASIDLAP